MTFWKSILVLASVGTLIWWWYPADHHKHGPDQKLVDHIHGMCETMDEHVDEPSAGVDALFAYYGQHTPDMMKQFGALLVVIERIDDDEAHDRRARLANRRISAALRGCEGTAEAFFGAVEGDPEASAKLERGVERLSRTFELLFSGAEVPASMQFLRGARVMPRR